MQQVFKFCFPKYQEFQLQRLGAEGQENNAMQSDKPQKQPEKHKNNCLSYSNIVVMSCLPSAPFLALKLLLSNAPLLVPAKSKILMTAHSSAFATTTIPSPKNPFPVPLPHSSSLPASPYNVFINKSFYFK